MALVMSRLLLVLMLFLFPSPGWTDGPSVAERYRQASPYYIQSAIPDNPGSIEIELATGAKHTLGFMGTAQLSRVTPPATPRQALFISTPGEKWNCGLTFYQGTSFSLGMPRRYAISASNRFRSEVDAYGTIRVVLWSGKQRYEIETGEIQIRKFRDQGRQGDFRIWWVEGSFTGRFERMGKAENNAPPFLRVNKASFACSLIEDRNPVPNRLELAFDSYYVPTLSLPVRAEFDPTDTVQAFQLHAFRTPEQGRYITHQFLFQVRNGANVSWPPAGEYLLNSSTVDPPDIFFPQYPGTKPLVMSLIFRPQLDVELHYLPTSGKLTFSSAQLLAANDTQEVWRVKGSFSGTFRLDDRKIGIGSGGWTNLAIHPAIDLEVVKITQATFDIRVRRPAVPRPAWQQRFPGIDPNAGLELPRV